MSVYLADPDVTIHHGDSLTVLRSLPDESVHMAVCSPPFFGLRDYGTGTWEGGDPDCDHAPDRNADTRIASSGLQGGQATNAARLPYRDVCGKCGARRVDQQIGLEETPDEWCNRLVDVFREVRRVLRSDGTCWIEVGDSYASSPPGNVRGVSDRSGLNGAQTSEKYRDRLTEGHGSKRDTSRLPGVKQKDLIGAPWMLAFALRADGWYLRADIIWHRPNPMPESVTDRPTKAHSYVFLLAKSARYFYDADAIREPSTGQQGAAAEFYRATGSRIGRTVGRAPSGNEAAATGRSDSGVRNKRSVWSIATQGTSFDHYAAYPEKLVEPCVLAGTSEHGVCGDCGAPWERETEKSIENPGNRSTNGQRERTDLVRGFSVRREVSVTTTGWRPTCGCDAPTVPATVLDPFLGSGTSAIVARRLGRHCIGIELNQKYCELAASRLAQQSLFAEEVA